MIRLPGKDSALRLLCGLFLLAQGSALAGKYPVAAVEASAACHASARQAAVAGLLVAAAKGRKVEYGGAVLQRDVHCYVHTTPVTSNRPNRLDYAVRRGQ